MNSSSEFSVKEYSPRRHEGHEGFRRVRFAHRSVSEYLPQRRQDAKFEEFGKYF